MLMPNIINAQNVGDAVRYSFFDPIGTARTVGVGSAFGAMGGDFSVISINPAGLGEYRMSEFNFSPSINNSSTNAYFVDDFGSNATRTNSSFNLDNIGFVSANNRRGTGWVTSNWAIGFSKLTDFDRSISIAGETEGTITDRFLEAAGNLEPEDLDGFEAGPAYDGGAIFLSDGIYVSDYLEGDIVQKSQVISQSGGINELSLAWAGNYNNKLNLGLSVGVPFVSFEERKTYKESVVDGNFSNDLEYIESLNTSGVGLNFKLGMQYKPTTLLRIGMAIQSPTWYNLNDDYSSRLAYAYSTQDESFSGVGESPLGSFKYKYESPWKFTGSIGSVLRLGDINGFINADIEFIDYTNNEFDFTAFSNNPVEISYTQEVNNAIDNVLGTATNYRLGSEFAYKKVRVRGGYTISTSPYVDESKTFNSWSAGLGFREDKFFIDLGYRARSTQEGYTPYIVEAENSVEPLANFNTDYGKFVATIGFKI